MLTYSKLAFEFSGASKIDPRWEMGNELGLKIFCSDSRGTALNFINFETIHSSISNTKK